MKDSFYFKHDLHAREDRKWSKLIRDYGFKAYGLGWAIIERLYEEGGRLPDDEKQLVYELRMDPAKDSVDDLRAVLASDLFYRKDGTIGSDSVDRRMADREDVRQSAVRAGKMSGLARRERSFNGRSNGVERLPNKEGEGEGEGRKEKEGEGEKSSPFAPLGAFPTTSVRPLGFGEHGDKPIPSIPPGYCRWVLTQCEQRHELDHLQIAALEDRAKAHDSGPALKKRKRCLAAGGCTISAEPDGTLCVSHQAEAEADAPVD